MGMFGPGFARTQEHASALIFSILSENPGKSALVLVPVECETLVRRLCWNPDDFRNIIPKCRGVPLHVHVDDNKGDSDSHLVPGAGTVDFKALAESLGEIGYTEFLSAELGTAYIMDPTAACRDTLAFFKSVFK